MENTMNAIREILFAPIADNLNLYKIISTVFKYIIIIIVFYYIYIVVKVIFLDVRKIYKDERLVKTHLELLEPYGIGLPEKYVIDHNFSIGSSEEMDLVLPAPTVSSRHAYIEIEDGNYYIYDTDSTNGTRVNGELVLGQKLEHEDIIGFADVKYQFYKGEDSDA